MKPNIARILLWVEALESGDRKQSTGKLTRVDANNENPSHCCLGVATEVALENGLEGVEGHLILENSVWMREYCWITAIGREVGEKNWMPTPVIKWLGLDDNDIRLPVERGSDAAVNSDSNGEIPASLLNDKYGFTFTQIAAAIRAKFGL